jgi:MFS family permease
VLVDAAGWEWIFFINVPVGIVAFVLAWRLVPKLVTHQHRFDILGVVLSAIGMFLLVFGIQEGETYNWGTIVGPISVWSLIIAGIVVLAGFVYWQHVNRGEPLLPLKLFRDRNFSLANLAITTVGFSITAMSLPLMIYAQTVRELSPTQSAFLMIPMALISGGLAPVVGKLVDRMNPKYIALFGLLCMAGSMFWLGSILSADVPIWLLLLPIALLGLANAGIWAPLSTTATRNLPPRDAGAGSGVYNTTRQVGAVLGSAGIAAIMQARLVADLPAGAGAAAEGGGVAGGGSLPEFLHAGFSSAMGQSLFLPAAVALIGAVTVIFFAKPKPPAWGPGAAAAASAEQPAAHAPAAQ